MAHRRIFLYFLRIMAEPHAGYRFELASIPQSSHGADDAFAGFRHVNTDLHLIHTVKGEGAVRVEDNRLRAAPDTVIAVPPLQPFDCEKDAGQPWHMLNIHFDIRLPGNVPLQQRMQLPLTFKLTNHRTIHRKLKQAVKAWYGRTVTDRFAASATVQQIIAGYLQQFGKPVEHKTHDEKIHQVCHAIEQNAGSRFDAARLAGRVHLSVSQLNRRFRAAIGTSPLQYWQQCRLALVQRALTETNQPLDAIAANFDFADQYYFSRWFRQLVGQPPGAYRRNNRGRSI